MISKQTLATAFFAVAFTAAGVAAGKKNVGTEEARSSGPALNPFECHGRYESATGNRTIGQMRVELAKKMDQLSDSDPGTVRAMKYCVIARLKQRVGDTDAFDWFEKAIAADPEEPGYELFAGMYWSGSRGAKAPVVERAEIHYQRALAKLKALESAERKEYHDTVEDWTRKRLLVLYQQDGQPLLPWKAYPYDPASPQLPGVSLSSQFRVAKDTRDFFYNSEMRTFTGELVFAESDIRAARRLTPRERWFLARAPWRLQVDNRVRIRQNSIGAIDLLHSYHHSANAQIVSFYQPTDRFTDIDVTQVGAGYERVFPLYPLFDFRLKGSYERVYRQGIVEFLPEREEEFNLVKVEPSFSRFFSSNKLTVDLVYAHMNVQDLPGGVPEQALREKVIRAGKIDYAIYSPLLFPSLHLSSLRPYRTPTRGLHLYAGAMQDDEVYGIRQLVRHDVYGGTQLKLPDWELTLQGTYYRSRTRFVDPNDRSPQLYTDPTQSFSSLRSTAVVQRRILNPDASPGLDDGTAGFVADELNLVFPVHWETKLEGPSDFSNVRAGGELWLKLYQYGTGGTSWLISGGYDAQYFYNLNDKVAHMGHLGIRMGWGDL